MTVNRVWFPIGYSKAMLLSADSSDGRKQMDWKRIDTEVDDIVRVSKLFMCE